MLFYNLTLFLIRIGAKLSSLFIEKNKKLIKGHKSVLSTISNKQIFSKSDFVIWIHSASLGEFEQARPIIEQIKSIMPNTKILASFFSPSGYEIRKNYPLADHVTYLPFDSKDNAENFINCFNPNLVLFIKYEFWYYYLEACKSKNIPSFSVSTILRSNQVFFKRKSSYNSVLSFFDHFFVQNPETQRLLKSIKLENSTLSGDTRFDRVISIRNQEKNIQDINTFCKHSLTVVIGSLWLKDLEYLLHIITQNNNINFIIAPHEIDQKNITSIQEALENKSILYSNLENNKPYPNNILIIDCIGKLTDIYSIADIAYVGGAFGSGLHNILEPATYGIPILFGSKYDKFQEAKDLVYLNGAFSVASQEELTTIFDTLKQDKNHRVKTGKICYDYVSKQAGATEKIMNHIKPLLIHER